MLGSEGSVTRKLSGILNPGNVMSINKGILHLILPATLCCTAYYYVPKYGINNNTVKLVQGGT
jgi:hypothetical protein